MFGLMQSISPVTILKFILTSSKFASPLTIYLPVSCLNRLWRQSSRKNHFQHECCHIKIRTTAQLHSCCKGRTEHVYLCVCCCCSLKVQIMSPVSHLKGWDKHKNCMPVGIKTAGFWKLAHSCVCRNQSGALCHTSLSYAGTLALFLGKLFIFKTYPKDTIGQQCLSLISAIHKLNIL
jgi:hypothetical protein